MAGRGGLNDGSCGVGGDCVGWALIIAEAIAAASECGVSYRAEMADEMLFCRSWFLLTESSSSEEKEGSVSKFLFSSSSRGLQGLGQLLRARSVPSTCSPSLNVPGGCCGGLGDREGGGGDKGLIPPFKEEQGFRASCSLSSCPVSRSDCFLPVFRKSKKEAMKAGLKSKAFSSAELESFCIAAQASGFSGSSDSFFHPSTIISSALC